MSRDSQGVRLVLAGLVLLTATACGNGASGQEEGRRDTKLEARVTDLLPQIEELARLEAREVPAVRRSSRETLEAYLVERLDAEYPGDTLENLAQAYKSFGLIPDTVSLRRLLVELLLEQAVGYYDPARDVLFIRKEAPKELLDAVIVHELVHALQDQRSDLDSLLRSTTVNDTRSARQAALEGHATVVMLAYQAGTVSGTQVSVDQLPELGPEMAAALADPASFPRLAEAPAIVKEPLLFAYLGGGRFVQRLWRRRAERPAPLGEWLPESTEQLIHTEKLLAQRDRPTALSLSPPSDGWQVRYASDLGELELQIYFNEHLGQRRAAERAAAGWDGDAYALLSRDGALALVWYTAWDSENDAREFEDAYRRVFAVRFEASADRLVGREREARIERMTISGTPMVRVIETPTGVELNEPPEVRLRSGG